eukprot:3867170-Pleurochrysis_carterae.AAC.2
MREPVDCLHSITVSGPSGMVSGPSATLSMKTARVCCKYPASRNTTAIVTVANFYALAHRHRPLRAHG